MVFAGTTVVISLLGMLIMQISFVTGLAVGAASVVAVTMVASVTLLPALLGFAGARVEVTRWRGLIAAGLVALGLVATGLGVARRWAPSAFVLAIGDPRRRASSCGRCGEEVPMRSREAPEETFSYRWSRAVQHHPVRSLVAGVVFLGVLALPVLALRLGFSDEGNYSEGTDTRTAYDLLAEGFGPGFNGPLLLAAELPEGTDPAALGGITDALTADPGRRAGRRARSPTPRTAHGRAVARHPHHRPAGRGHHRAGRPAPRRRAARSARPTPASTSPSPAAWPCRSTSPTTWPPGCPGSSAPC